jgi:hypothetical protein
MDTRCTDVDHPFRTLGEHLSMMIKSTLRTIATALFVLGYAVAGPGLRSAGAQTVNCPGASCDVTVTVTGNPASPTIGVSANQLRMEKGKRDVMITWKLENAPDFEFRADSIKPYVGAPNSGKQTTTQAAWDAQVQFQNSNDKQYKVKNANSASATLYYDVKVYRKSTGVAHTLDPVIYNDP